jgi:hypothetical protein
VDLQGLPMTEVLSAFLRAADSDKGLCAVLQKKVEEQQRLHAVDLVAWSHKVREEVIERYYAPQRCRSSLRWLDRGDRQKSRVGACRQ